MRRSLRSLGALAVLAACLLAPATAGATLVFTRNALHPAVFAAGDDGAGAHRLGAGLNPRVSPDGQTVVYYRFGGGSEPPALMEVAAAGGAPKRLASGWRNPSVFAWSPDSTEVAVVLGPEIGRQRLTTIDVGTGAQRTLARGYFNGVSFAPGGGQLVYGRSNSEFGAKSDVFRFDAPEPGAIFVQAPQPVRLTGDHRSADPLWGPNETIVFVKHLGAKRRRYGPKNDLFLMNPSGGRLRRLTHTRVEPLLTGLSPTEWSASGKQLLAEFGGQDTTYAVAVNPRTGAERTFTREREVGFVGTALSADGRLVLGSIGGFEPGPGHEVVTIPYGGGRPRVLAKNASEPDWSR